MLIFSVSLMSEELLYSVEIIEFKTHDIKSENFDGYELSSVCISYCDKLLWVSSGVGFNADFKIGDNVKIMIGKIKGTGNIKNSIHFMFMGEVKKSAQQVDAPEPASPAR